MGRRAYALGVAASIALGLLIRAPLLQTGFMVDDYAQLAMMRGDYPVARGPLELFTFSDGSAHEVDTLRRAGFFPWWARDDLRLAMFRPLACALMWIDRAVFGDYALGYHLHSALWWVLMMAALSTLLAELLPPAAALLGVVLFALDDSHGMPLGWIALRNCLVASTFAIAALALRIRARERAAPRLHHASLMCAVLALAASEYALAFVGYAVAYELWRDGPLRTRMRAAAPVLVLAALYLVLRRSLGFGSHGSDMYVDPVRSPAAFALAASDRGLALLGDLALAVPAGWWSWGSPLTNAFVHAGLVPASAAADLHAIRALQAIGGIAGGLVLVGLFVAMRAQPLLRARSWLLLGAVLAVVPVLGAFPDARLLMPAQAGFSAALAALIHRGVTALGMRARTPRAWLAALLPSGLAALQLTASLTFGAGDIRIGALLPDVVRRSILRLPIADPDVPTRHLLLLNASDPTTTIYVPLLRRAHGRSTPASCHLLSAAHVPQRLRRVSAHAFTLQRLQGGLTAGDVYASAFNDRPLTAGRRVDLGVLRVSVLEVDAAGRPTLVRFEHALDLDDPRLVLLFQSLHGLIRVRPPPIGGELNVPPPLPPLLQAPDPVGRK